MYKKILTAVLAGVMSLIICSSSFAADKIAKGGRIYTPNTGVSTDAEGNTITAGSPWIKTADGAYQYKDSDGNILKDTITPDGYYVDANGNWNGASNNAIAMYPIIGKTIFKSNADAVLDEKKIYNFTVTVYDTAFFTEAEIKKIKKGDTVVLPGLNITTTAITNGKSSKIVRNTATSVNGEKTTTSKSSGAKVTLQDADGNTYTCSSKFTTEKLADGTTKSLMRTVATNIPVVCPAYREARQDTGSSHLSNTATIITTGLYFETKLIGNTVDELYDSAYNYGEFKPYADDEITPSI